MNDPRHQVAAVLVILFSLPSWAGGAPQVSVVARGSSFIRVEAQGFEVKPERALFYRIRFAGSDLGPLGLHADERRTPCHDRHLWSAAGP